MNRSTYYSVDIEATGPVPGLFSMVSIGVTAVLPGPQGLSVGPSFYAELRPVFGGHDPSANAVHKLDIARLTREGLEPATALSRLSAFVAETRAPGTQPVFVGHVAVFDWMYVAWYYAWCGIANPFGYKGLDTKSLAVGALGIAWPDTGKETLEGRLGLPPQEESSLHRADADARHQAELLIALLRASNVGE